jgi:hypothetical protein
MLDLLRRPRNLADYDIDSAFGVPQASIGCSLAEALLAVRL